MKKGCAYLVALVVGVPLLVVAVVGLQTWFPLERAASTLDELDDSLGAQADYVPSPSGEIPAPRLELFLEIRADLVTACDEYGTVQSGFESVSALDTMETGTVGDVGEVTYKLGGAALSITPFLARFFEMRNDALLAAGMGLQEYVYIYAVSYLDTLLSDRTRSEIFSDGLALSPEASVLLRECLTRQREGMGPSPGGSGFETTLNAEVEMMEDDTSRLIWQDGLPEAVLTSLTPFRARLDQVFCGPTAGLEMEQDARRALRIALE